MPHVRWYVGNLACSQEAKGRSALRIQHGLSALSSEVFFRLAPVIRCFANPQEEFCSAVFAISIRILFVYWRLKTVSLISSTIKNGGGIA